MTYVILIVGFLAVLALPIGYSWNARFPDECKAVGIFNIWREGAYMLIAIYGVLCAVSFGSLPIGVCMLALESGDSAAFACTVVLNFLVMAELVRQENKENA